jgi:hypothetical protein
MGEEEGVREGASFPTFCTFQGVLKSYEDNHYVKFVIRHSRTLVAHNKRVKESEKLDAPQKCRDTPLPPPPPCTGVARFNIVNRRQMHS